MDAQQIRRSKPKLDRYLKRFADGFVRKDTRGHFPVYVQGQLSELHRKSVEPIAKQAGVPVRTLQEFLSLLKWDEERMRDRLQAIVAAEHASPRAVGVIDETSFAKQGEKTPGVKRQYCGSPPAGSVKQGLKQHPRLRDKAWKRYRLRTGTKGPMVWEVKVTWFYPQDEEDLPGPRLRLVIARNVLNPKQIKFFLADAPLGTPVGTLLPVGHELAL